MSSPVVVPLPPPAISGEYIGKDQNQSQLPGFNVMVIGPSGAGKTTSIESLIKCGITPFCLFTEPGFEVIGKVPKDQLHWHYIPPASQDFQTMIEMSEKINQYSFKSLTEMTDTNRRKFDQFVDVLKCLNNFTCQRDGKTYGPVDKWGTDRALVLDSLTGINIMAMSLVVGGKPVRSQADWGVAQNVVESLIQKLCTDTRCHFILMAHAERELDEVAGGSKIMAATLGKKLAPKLPRFFSDVVLAVKEAATFTWSTAQLGADLKARNLPIKDGLPQSFDPIYQSWKSRGGVLVPTVDGGS